MTESILRTVRIAVNLDEENSDFDTQLIPMTNTALMAVHQLVHFCTRGFVVTNQSQEWIDFCSRVDELAAIKSYVSYKVLLMFDHTLSSGAVQSINEILKELEFRLEVADSEVRDDER